MWYKATYVYTSFYKSVESSTLLSSTGDSLLVAIQPHQPTTSQPAMSQPACRIELTEDDILGAHLNEPYERHNVQALKCLFHNSLCEPLCHGCAPFLWRSKSNSQVLVRPITDIAI